MEIKQISTCHGDFSVQAVMNDEFCNGPNARSN